MFGQSKYTTDFYIRKFMGRHVKTHFCLVIFKIHLMKAEWVFFYLHVYILVCGWVVVTLQDQTKNDTDLKFGTQISLDHT